MLLVEPEVIEKYVRPGRARLVFRDVLNHGERSQRTAEAAVCAGQQQSAHFWRMHELLFARQDVTERTAPAQLVPLLQQWGAEIEGLDRAAFGTCLSARAPLQSLQAVDAAQRRQGITSQPIFEIGPTGLGSAGGAPAPRRLFGSQSLQQISAAIDVIR